MIVEAGDLLRGQTLGFLHDKQAEKGAEDCEKPIPNEEVAAYGTEKERCDQADDDGEDPVEAHCQGQAMLGHRLAHVDPRDWPQGEFKHQDKSHDKEDSESLGGRGTVSLHVCNAEPH